MFDADADAGDILLEMEKRIGIELNLERANSLIFKRYTGDVTMRELHEFTCGYSPICRKCRYDLRGQTGVGRCPECGTAFDLGDHADGGRWHVSHFD